MRIGMDLDGVVADFIGYVLDVAGTPRHHKDVTSWNKIAEFTGHDGDTVAMFDWLNEEHPHLFRNLRPLPGALDFLHWIVDEGHELVVITSRPRHAALDTWSWLDTHEVSYDEVHVTKDKAAVDPPCDVYVDDGSHNLGALVQAHPEALVVRWVQPWNDWVPGSIPVHGHDWLVLKDLIHAQEVANERKAKTQIANWAAGGPAPDEQVARRTLGKVRSFDTGATRDVADHKYDYEGFLSPLVVREFARYMHANRTQSDGSLRDSDNWQKGIPLDAYMKSAWRHFHDLWMLYRGFAAVDFDGKEVDIKDALAAILFNVQGYLHEVLTSEESSDVSQ